MPLGMPKTVLAKKTHNNAFAKDSFRGSCPRIRAQRDRVEDTHNPALRQKDYPLPQQRGLDYRRTSNEMRIVRIYLLTDSHPATFEKVGASDTQK
jgi:hypothetical protein